MSSEKPIAGAGELSPAPDGSLPAFTVGRDGGMSLLYWGDEDWIFAHYSHVLMTKLAKALNEQMQRHTANRGICLKTEAYQREQNA